MAITGGAWASDPRLYANSPGYPGYTGNTGRTAQSMVGNTAPAAPDPELVAARKKAELAGLAQAGQTGTPYQTLPNSTYPASTMSGGSLTYGSAPTAQFGMGTGSVTTTGGGQLSNPAYEQQQQTMLEAMLQQQSSAAAQAAAAKKAEALKGLIYQFGGGSAPTVGFGGMGAQEQAARDAAYARAKEQAGLTAKSAMKSLNDVMAERGLTGSSVERGNMGSVMSQAAGTVGDYTREQLMQDLNRSADVADLSYTGAVTQRGQDLSSRNYILGLLNAIY